MLEITNKSPIAINARRTEKLDPSSSDCATEQKLIHPVPVALEMDNETEEQLITITMSEKLSKRCPFIGILLTIIAGIHLSLCSVIVKLMVDIHPMELAVCRYIGLLVLAIPTLLWTKENVFPKGKRLQMVIRSFIATFDIMLQFYAFRRMPVGEASVIVYSLPVYAAFLACLFLKEPCGLIHVVAITLTLTGVILVRKPAFLFGEEISGLTVAEAKTYQDYAYGTVAAVLSSLCGAVAYVMLRNFRSLHFSAVLVNYGVIALVITVSTSWYMEVLRWPNSVSEWRSVVAIGVFTFVALLLITIALKLENVGPVTVARTSEMVIAFIWQILFFNQFSHLYSVIGAILIIVSVSALGMRNWILILPEDALLRRTFGILAK